MDWLRKVKEWSGNLLTKVTGLFRSEPLSVSKVVEAEVVERNVLDVVARKNLALGPSELTETPKVFVDAFVAPSCDHDYRLLQQKWVKVAAKKFELKNEVKCSHCKEVTVTSIE